MRAISASFALAATLTLLLAGTLTTSAREVSHAVSGVVVALNPQPLPPIVDDHDFDEDFRG